MNTVFRLTVVWLLFFLTLGMWIAWMFSLMIILPADVLPRFILGAKTPIFHAMDPAVRMILDTAPLWLLLVGLPIYSLFVRLNRRWYGKVKYVENSAWTSVVETLQLVPKA
jgi:hypothetical protein